MKPDGPQLGKLINGEAYRDAIHIAIAPVVAAQLLHPGWPIGLNKAGLATLEQTSQDVRPGEEEIAAIGIVDPFLRQPVNKGERFWLFLYPNTITGLRHVWLHPAFKAKVPTTGGRP